MTSVPGTGGSARRQRAGAPAANGLVIVIDALAARYGGAAYAAVEIAGALERRGDVARVVVVTTRGSLVGRGLHSSPTMAVMEIDGLHGGRLAQRVAWETFQLPGLTRRSGAHAVVSLSGMLPRALPVPVVAVLANPMPFTRSASVLDRARRAAIARTVRTASAVYTPSAHLAHLGGLQSVARVVPLGVDRRKFRPAETPGQEVICVGDFYAHKRHDLVIEAWKRLPQPRPVLRLVGDPAVAPACYRSVCRRAAGLPGVVIEGHVSLSRLTELYRSARMLVIASEQESFSLPIAEAMASGVPAVLRDHPAMRETAGDSAVHVPQPTPQSLADGMRRLLEDDLLHLRLRSEAMRRAERFRWEDWAEAMVTDITAAGAGR